MPLVRKASLVLKALPEKLVPLVLPVLRVQWGELGKSVPKGLPVRKV